MNNLINEKIIETVLNEIAKNIAVDIITNYHVIEQCNIMIRDYENDRVNMLKDVSQQQFTTRYDSQFNYDNYIAYRDKEIENLKAKITIQEQQMIQKRSFYTNELNMFLETINRQQSSNSANN